VDFELGVVKLDEKTFFDAVVLAEEFGVGKFSFFFSFNIQVFFSFLTTSRQTKTGYLFRISATIKR
jgi:hypothetical protein